MEVIDITKMKNNHLTLVWGFVIVSWIGVVLLGLFMLFIAFNHTYNIVTLFIPLIFGIILVVTILAGIAYLDNWYD